VWPEPLYLALSLKGNKGREDSKSGDKDSRCAVGAVLLYLITKTLIFVNIG